MRLSSRTRYGVRALFDLAYHSGGRPTCIRDIADRQDIPPRYLEQVCLELKRHGLIASKRGPRGGYLLSRPPNEITLGQVFRAIEGPVSFGRCLHDHAEAFEPEQHITGRCVTGEIWGRVSELLTEYLDSLTVADLSERAHELGLEPARAPMVREAG